MNTTVTASPNKSPTDVQLRGPQYEGPAQLAQPRRRWRLVPMALILFTTLWGQAGPANENLRPRFGTPGDRDITILDQNVYVGSEFNSILTLDPTDPDYVVNLLMAVAEVYQTIVASDYSKRAEALAVEIAATRPELVALQEVSLLRIQVPGDLLIGGNTLASEVQLDYLGILLAKLRQQGAEYVAVAMVTNMDMELPMPTATPGVFADVRLTDHDVILARADLPPGHLRVSQPQACNFQTALPLPTLGASIPRGWCAVDVTSRGRTFRFINSHLEENTAASIQAAQAQELLAGPANTTLPVILAGDFNSDANGTDGTTTYDMLTKSLTDAWSAVHLGELGFTWGHDPLLADSSAAFVWRLDLVLFEGSLLQALDMWRLTPQMQAAPPMWLSDHAGLVARLRIR